MRSADNCLNKQATRELTLCALARYARMYMLSIESPSFSEDLFTFSLSSRIPPYQNFFSEFFSASSFFFFSSSSASFTRLGLCASGGYCMAFTASLRSFKQKFIRFWNIFDGSSEEYTSMVSLDVMKPPLRSIDDLPHHHEWLLQQYTRCPPRSHT